MSDETIMETNEFVWLANLLGCLQIFWSDEYSEGETIWQQQDNYNEIINAIVRLHHDKKIIKEFERKKPSYGFLKYIKKEDFAKVIKIQSPIVHTTIYADEKVRKKNVHVK